MALVQVCHRTCKSFIRNIFRRIWLQKLNLIYLAVTLTLVLYLADKIRNDVSSLYERREVEDYIRWWEAICEARTNPLLLHADDEDRHLPLCPCIPEVPHANGEEAIMGYLRNKSKKSLLDKNSAIELDPGGHWRPTKCRPRQKVAIIIPYRNREHHLRILIPYLHPFLQAQMLEYQIFIVEQVEPRLFNRAALMNIGFLEAQLQRHFDCFIFHDVDLLPLDYRNSYSCFMSPTHLGAYMNKFDYQMPYYKFFGGAVAISTEHLSAMNGFSNRFYGWGGEDDDTYNRVLWRNLSVHRHIQPIGKSYMFKHEEDEGNPKNPKRDVGYSVQPEQYLANGINSIVYTAHQRDRLPTYTRLLVSIAKEYLSECIVNASLPATAPNNYVECLNAENYEEGNVDCCRESNYVVKCCQKIYPYPSLIQPKRSTLLWLVLFCVAIFISLTIIKAKSELIERLPRKLQGPVHKAIKYVPHLKRHELIALRERIKMYSSWR